MEIKNYESKYEDSICDLWNEIGVKQGFIPAEGKAFEELITKHPYFANEYAFVLLDDTQVVGFACGCASDELPRGKERGYLTCLLVRDEVEEKYAIDLLDNLGAAFRKNGKETMVSNFFNPMRLPWVMPETDGCIHNNAPGIAIDLGIYSLMQNYGFETVTKECAMHLDLDGFQIPEKICEKEKEALSEGYHVEWYDHGKHTHLVEMVEEFGNLQWNQEIPYEAEHRNMMIAAYGNEAAGFAGPVYPEPTGRGYFAGIGVAKKHEKHGLGTLLFYKLCEAEKEAGAKYMSLFTGEQNPAKNIYKRAGFEEKRVFAVMVKAL